MKSEPTIQYDGIHCQLAIDQPGPGVVVLRLAGWDAGEFGDLAMQHLERILIQQDAVELFVDARRVKGASIEVSGEWSQWLGKHRSRFKHVSMLTGSRFIQITANFVRRFADLHEVMRIYTDAAAFDAALAEASAA